MEIYTSNKYLDEQKIKNDENLIENYYKNKGYYNVNVKSSYAKNINNEFFELNFNIDAGKKYFFNNISIKSNDDFNKINFKYIIKIKELLGKKIFSKKLNKINDEIDNLALEKEYVFVDTKYDLKVNDNKIDIIFKFNNLKNFM